MQPVQPSAKFAGSDDEIDLTDIARAISAQWHKIVLLAAATTLFAALYVLHSRPAFTINGSLYLGDAQSSPSGGSSVSSDLGFLSDFSSVSDVETQIELIQAKALIEQAILETGLNAPVARQGSPSLRYWRWKLFSGGEIDAFAPKPGDVQALFATLAEPTSKTKSFQIIFGDNGSYRIFRPGGAFSSPLPILSGVLGQPAAGAGLSLVLKPAIDGAIPTTGSRFVLWLTPVEAVEAELVTKGVFSVSAGGTVTQPTKIANLQMVYPNPYDGLRFLGQVMQDFIASQVAWKTQSASVTERFINDQLNTIQDELFTANRNLATYQSKTGILDVPTNAKEVLDQLSQYEVQRTTAQLQEEALRQLAHEIAHPVGDLNPYLVSQANDLVLGQLASSLASAQVQLQALRVQFTGNAPEIEAQQATIAKIEDSIRTLVRNDLSLAVINLADVDTLIAQYESQLKLMPAESLQVISLSRSSDVYGNLYVLLMEKKEEAEVSKAASIANTRVVTPPQLPLNASKPKVATTMLIGLFFGLFAGVVLIVGQRALSGRFQSDDEIRRTVPLPLYGLIPFRARAERNAQTAITTSLPLKLIPLRARAESNGNIISSRTQGPFAEAFRLMRGNLYQSAPGAKSKVILITSASVGDGKTTVGTNLAKSLVESGRKVLLMDGDLHRGNLHGVLGLNQTPGLTEWLVSGKRPAFQNVPGQGFAVVTTGMLPPNPSELLHEAAFGTLCAALREEFDHVVIDGPPLPAVSDAMSLGLHADLVLSIIRVGQTKRRAFFVHNETFSALDCRRGMIINAVTSSDHGYGYGYGYGKSQTRDQAGRLWAWLRNLWERLG